jgi:hypothetical protein
LPLEGKTDIVTGSSRGFVLNLRRDLQRSKCNLYRRSCSQKRAIRAAAAAAKTNGKTFAAAKMDQQMVKAYKRSRNKYYPTAKRHTTWQITPAAHLTKTPGNKKFHDV